MKHNQYSEEMPIEEKASVTKYKGYYIGRYEAGIKTARTTAGDQTKVTMADLGEVLEKKTSPYTYVTRNQAMNLSTEIKSHYNYGGITLSKLCSSYAWDTALKFIDSSIANYSTSSSQGNYSGLIKNTGLSTAVCEIYDMGGNVWEYTTENYTGSEGIYVTRGGCYDTPATFSACRRSYDTANKSINAVGFRPTLYL